MRRNIVEKLQQFNLREIGQRLKRDQNGNVLIMVAASLIPLIGLVGSGVDISRAYMAQLRLQQACDAGVLAGRRAMAAKVWSDTAKEEADRMFFFNFPRNMYGATKLEFVPSSSAADVEGKATATLPTVIMGMFPFGKKEFELTADCTAKLEISNTDVMLVLDVTGSMKETMSGNSGGGGGSSGGWSGGGWGGGGNSGGGSSGSSQTRIEALRDAALVFFDTLTGASRVGDGRLRIGMVPYSSNVNVGQILIDKDPSWISDHLVMPSRVPVYTFTPQKKSGNNFSDGMPTYSDVTGSWEDVAIASGFDTKKRCEDLKVPANSFPVDVASNNNILPDANQASRVEFNSSAQNLAPNGKIQKYYTYQYKWSDGSGARAKSCMLQRAIVTRNITQDFQYKSRNNQNSGMSLKEYRYEERVFNVSNVKSGGKLLANIEHGASNEFSWGGCVLERRTTPFADSQTAPENALDVDIDLVPNDVISRWSVFIPEIGYYRTSYNGKPDNLDVKTGDKDKYKHFGSEKSNGVGVCPDLSRKLTEMKDTDRSTFKKWIDDLTPVGGTYHDIGMVWGLRLISPDGLFSVENKDEAAPNKRPIGRHVIFMTDGLMAPNAYNVTANGYEYFNQRVTGDINAGGLTQRHNNRFFQLCERAKEKNITVWVIAFDVNGGDAISDCATAGKFYRANSASDLSAVFRDIAGQISRLRLSR